MMWGKDDLEEGGGLSNNKAERSRVLGLGRRSF